MFGKLLKYDFKSVKRFGLPILIGLGAATVLGILGLVGSILTFGTIAAVNEVLASLLEMLLGVLMMAVIFVLAAAGIGMQIATYYDFYRSLVTDEAYLTFTLPVRSRKILFSKLLNAFIWQCIASAAVTVAVILLILSGVTASGALPNLFKLLAALDLSIPGNVWLLIAQGCLLCLVYAVNSTLLFFMAIFFGSIIAKKNKLLAIIGCVFGANMIYSTVVQGVFSVLGFTAAFSGKYILVTLNVIAAVSTVLLLGLSVLFFKLTEYMMDKKLNLA